MRTVMRPRYYCDYCGKAGGNAGAMKKHERRCTNNPNRECGVCNLMGFRQKPIAELVAALGRGHDENLDRLREVAENCPACILAAIRQSGVQYPMDEEGPGHWVEYDFKTELKELMKEYNYHQNRCN